MAGCLALEVRPHRLSRVNVSLVNLVFITSFTFGWLIPMSTAGAATRTQGAHARGKYAAREEYDVGELEQLGAGSGNLKNVDLGYRHLVNFRVNAS